ncbi:hypothetical protein TNCV_3135641 [Trichonephila clavipes]|nr:hypothetical protein TNCV_3135641 [Trichonephila clavipes]
MRAYTVTKVTQNRHGCEHAFSRNIQNGTDHSRLRNSQKIFLFTSLKKGNSALKRRPLDLQSNALPLIYTPASANLCFAFRRNEYENSLSRNIQNGTGHSRLRNSQKIFLFTSLKKGNSALKRRPLHLQSNALPLIYTPASANLCFAFRRNEYENSLSRNIQNGTGHSRLRNSQKIFLFTSLKKGNSALKRRPLDLQSNALSLIYTPASANLALRSVGTNTKIPCLEIYRMGQKYTEWDRSFPPSKFSENISFHFPEEGELSFETETSRSAVQCSTTNLYPRVSEPCFAFRRNEYENSLSRNIQNGTGHSRLRNSQKIFLFTSLKKGNSALKRRPLDLQSNALPLIYTPASANLCFAFRRNEYENSLSRNIQNGTGHSRLRNSQKIFLFTSLKKGNSALKRRPLDLQSNALPLIYTPASANLALRSVGTNTKNSLSRNIQNGTGHSRLRNSQKIFLFTSLKKGNSALKRRPLDLQSNALPLIYTPASANALLCVP